MPDSNKSQLKEFIRAYQHEDPAAVALKLKGMKPAEKAFLLTQLKLYKKAAYKLPDFTKAWCSFTEKSYEQSSSEALALYKSSLVPEGDTMLDICAGLGVDDWAFSKKFKKVVSLDIDATLNSIVRDNFERLGIHNIERKDADANIFLRKTNTFDFIYADTDRRAEGKRLPALEDARPDLLSIRDRLLELAPLVMVKLSPMLDLSEVIKRLGKVHEIHVVSHANEVKELLVLMQRGEAAQVRIRAVDITVERTQYFEGIHKQGRKPAFSDKGSYLYEPAAALIKAGLAQDYAVERGLSMIAANAYYFLSEEPVKDFFGRSFRIIGRTDFSKLLVRGYLDKAEVYQANVSKRNFPMEVEELRKLFTIEDGGNDYLFFTQNGAGRKIVFHGRKSV